jgi:hypothetical protein
MRRSIFVTVLCTAVAAASLAAQDRKPQTPDEWASEFRAGIKEKCEKEWNDDYRMQAYCIKQQQEALGKLSGRSDALAANPRAGKARLKCLSDWSTPAGKRADGSDRYLVDWRMVNYCEEQQLKALAELGGR